jgi:glycosyltransferase involved in cell wall biosynthesis
MGLDRFLRVAVLIDHRPNHPGETGGLAGTWEQISRAAAGHEDLDLTVFFLGDSRRVVHRYNNVRHVLLRPALGTESLPFLKGIPTHTDLAPFHTALFRRLRGFDLLHTTDAFHAFAKTALWVSRLRGTPVVNSIQTDIIGWARIHTPGILRRILPGRVLVHLVLERYGYLDRQQGAMERRFGRYMQGCRAVFVSHERDLERVRRLSPTTPIFSLRRGIDLERFHPGRRDRQSLVQRFGLPRDRVLLLFVGRIDPVKGALVAAEAVQRLIQRGHKVHLLVVGDGAQREQVQELLKEHATLTGNLPHEELGWIYASADLLLFPSEAEVWPNVVMEARASGLAVMACERGAGHIVEGSGIDGILLPDRSPENWSSAITGLLHDPGRLQVMGRRARESTQAKAPSWNRVLEEDLLQVWRQFASPHNRMSPLPHG